MFATLLAGLPTPDQVGASPIEVAIRAQEDAGLEPLTDGRLSDPGFGRLIASLSGGIALDPGPVAAWRFAAALTERAVKQTLPGPYSLGHTIDASGAPGPSGVDRATRTVACADALRQEIQALVAAGCPMIEIEETDAHRIGQDEAERALFREAHVRLTDGIGGTHLSLSIVGRAADAAGIETILAAPYASLAVDLIEGPDNWNLVTRTAEARGIVVGAMGADERRDEPREILLWAAHYAASTMGRGGARVGLGSAGSWTHLSWATAVRKMRALGTAAKLAAMPPGEELLEAVDSQAVSARRAALGSRASRIPKPRRTL
ncbi:MAG: hypothetical protein ABI620_04380 [Chloroflexota bacterium]